MHTGDVLTFPSAPDSCWSAGQVYNASPSPMFPAKKTGWYLRRAGGTNDVANRKEIFVVRANGTVIGSDRVNGMEQTFSGLAWILAM